MTRAVERLDQLLYAYGEIEDEVVDEFRVRRVIPGKNAQEAPEGSLGALSRKLPPKPEGAADHKAAPGDDGEAGARCGFAR